MENKIVKIYVKASIYLVIFSVIFLLAYIGMKGIPNINLQMFELEYNSDNLSIIPAIINTMVMVIISIVIVSPIAIFSAIYLEEYLKKGNKLTKLIEITIETLSGIPSIIYGLFGFLFFVSFLNMGFSLIAGIFTVSIMIFPIIIRVTQEAIKNVPMSYKLASYGLGAGKIRTIFKIIIPNSINGILTGVILSVGRIVGESAALIYTSGTAAQVAGIKNSGRTLAIHMYALSSEGLHIDQAYASGVILIILVLIINYLTNKISKKVRKNEK